MKALECPCGASNLVAKRVTIRLRGLPFTLTEDGPQYDDSEAEYSEGWDFNQETRCRCASCGAVYDIASDDDANLYLEPVPKRAGGT